MVRGEACLVDGTSTAELRTAPQWHTGGLPPQKLRSGPWMTWTLCRVTLFASQRVCNFLQGPHVFMFSDWAWGLGAVPGRLILTWGWCVGRNAASSSDNSAIVATESLHVGTYRIGLIHPCGRS